MKRTMRDTEHTKKRNKRLDFFYYTPNMRPFFVFITLESPPVRFTALPVDLLGFLSALNSRGIFLSGLALRLLGGSKFSTSKPSISMTSLSGTKIGDWLRFKEVSRWLLMLVISRSFLLISFLCLFISSDRTLFLCRICLKNVWTLISPQSRSFRSIRSYDHPFQRNF